MFEWFKTLDSIVQAAIIGACATIVAAIIAGIFSLIKKNGKPQNSTTIKQKQSFWNNGLQVGVQNNYKIDSCANYNNTGDNKNE